MIADFRIKGRSQIYRAGGGRSDVPTGPHGWRCSVPGSQVVADGANVVVQLSTDVIADTDGYWDAIDPHKVTIPGGLGGVYVLGGDLATPAYLAGLILEVTVNEDGDGEDPADFADGDFIHTRTPRSENPLTGFYRVKEGGVLQLKVLNNTGGSKTLEKGSFTGALLLPDQLVGDPRLAHCQWTDASLVTDHESCHLSVAGDRILLMLFFQQKPNSAATYPAGWNVREVVDGVSTLRYSMLDKFIPDAGTSLDAFLDIETAAATRAHGAFMAFRAPEGGDGEPKETHSAFSTFPDQTDTTMEIALDDLPDIGDILIGYVTATNNGGSGATADELFSWPGGWRKLEAINPSTPEIGGSELRYKVSNGAETVTAVQYNATHVSSQTLFIANYGPLILR